MAVGFDAVRVRVLAHQSSVLFEFGQQPGQDLGDGPETGFGESARLVEGGCEVRYVAFSIATTQMNAPRFVNRYAAM